jgi:hypothetical protein
MHGDVEMGHQASGACEQAERLLHRQRSLAAKQRATEIMIRRRSSAERFRNVGVAGHRPPPQAPRQTHRAAVRQASIR